MKRSLNWQSEISCQDPSSLDQFISSHLITNEPEKILLALSVLSSITQSDFDLSVETIRLIGNTLNNGNDEIKGESLSALLNISQLNPRVKQQIIELNFLPTLCSSITTTSIESFSEITKLIEIIYEFSKDCNYFATQLALLLEKCCANDNLYGMDFFEQLSLCCFLHSIDCIDFKINISIPLDKFTNTPAFVYLAGIMLLNGTSLFELQSFFCAAYNESNTTVSFMTVIVNYTRLALEESLSIESLFHFLQSCNFNLQTICYLDQLEDLKIMVDWFDFYSTLLTNNFFNQIDDKKFVLFLTKTLTTIASDQNNQMVSGDQVTKDQFLDSLLQLLRSTLLIKIISLDSVAINWLVVKTQNEFNIYALGILNILAKNNINSIETISLLHSLLNCNSEIVVEKNLEFYCECLDGLFDIFGDDTKDDIWVAKQFPSLMLNFKSLFGEVVLRRKFDKKNEIYGIANETLETLNDFIGYMNNKK